MSSSEFKPYRWIRAIGRSELPKRCRDLLRCLAAEMRPGLSSVQLRQRELLDLMGMTDHHSLREAVEECIELGWLAVDKTCRPYAYIAKPGNENYEDEEPEMVETTNSNGGNHHKEMVETTNSNGGNHHKPISEMVETTNSNGGNHHKEKNRNGGNHHKQMVVTTTSPYYREKAENISAAAARAPARENSFEELSVETKELLAMLAHHGHSLTPAQAEDLKQVVASFHPSALRYIARRVHQDEICRRFRNTTGLLRALKDDAARDGVPQRSLFPAPKDRPSPSPAASLELEAAAAPYSARREDPRPKDTYEHPEAWRRALETLGGQISRDEFKNSLVPIRAAESPEGITLFAGDDFRAAWLNDKHRDLIEAALSLPLIEISARRLS